MHHVPHARHGCRVVMLGLLLACGSANGCKSEAGGGERTSQKSSGDPPISAVCKERVELEPSVQAELEQAARSVHQALVQGDIEAVKGTLHPQARRDERTVPTISEALQAMSERLQGTDASQATVHRMAVVDVEGGVSDLARAICPGSKTLDRITMLLNAGNEDVALVTLRSAGQPLGRTTTLVLRRHGDRWATVAVHVGPHAYRGRSAKELEAAGAAATRADKTLPAFLLFAMARTLADRGETVSTQTRERLDEKLANLQANPTFGRELGVWELEGQRFDLQRLSLASTRSDVSPVVHYISPGGLVREHLEREADLLVAEVRRRYPELHSYFDAIVFEAAVARPKGETAAKKDTYDAYRIVRFLDPKRAQAKKVGSGDGSKAAKTPSPEAGDSP